MEKKILLIEDSELDTEIISDTLTKSNFKVYSAKTVKEGFEKAIEVKPDIILLDLMLPDGNGFDLCKRIKSEEGLGSKTLVIIVSIKNELKDIERAFASGADDYVVKPPTPDSLLRKVQLYLRD